MKKILISVFIVLILLSISSVYATETNILATNTTSKIQETKNKAQAQIDEYVESYGSQSYGMAAYVLNIVRLYSIPFCFLGIVIGAIFQYAIGTRRLDMKQKGFNLIIASVTILLICQVLPLIFVIVVKGWRG